MSDRACDRIRTYLEWAAWQWAVENWRQRDIVDYLGCNRASVSALCSGIEDFCYDVGMRGLIQGMGRKYWLREYFLKAGKPLVCPRSGLSPIAPLDIKRSSLDGWPDRLSTRACIIISDNGLTPESVLEMGASRLLGFGNCGKLTTSEIMDAAERATPDFGDLWVA